MSQTPLFCRFPGDPEGWRHALVEASRAGSWAEHCVLEGLKVDCIQCETLALTGLTEAAASRPASDNERPLLDGLRGDVLRACEEVVLHGYHSGTRAAGRILYLAYHRIVRFAARRIGFTSETQPGDDDIVQDVFISLHKFFKRGGSVQPGCLRGYVWRSAVHACQRAVSKRPPRPPVPLDDEYALAAADTGALNWVELWHDLDRQLYTSKPGDLINRVILAQMCLEAPYTGKKGPVDELLAGWRRLAETPEKDLRALHEEVTARVRQEPQQSPVRLTAEMIESGAAEAAQVALILAAATGLTFDETREQLNHLRGLSANAVSVRRSRMYDAMAPPQDK